MRIAIDLDGTICSIKDSDQSYNDVQPLPGAAEKIRQLRAAGHYIVIQTARNMATCDGNLGKVIKNVGLTTMAWLAKHGIEYDELYFGKPNAELYIDDRGIRFVSWEDITPELIAREAKSR
jgi:capsule biosynthesis phosphatase